MAKIKSYDELIKAIQKEDWGVTFRTPNLSTGVSIVITVGDNAVTDFRHIHTNRRDELVMDTVSGLVFSKTEYSDSYAEKMKALLDNVDKGALFRNMYDKSMDLLAEKLPVVYEFISSCDLQEDKSAGTLYATFDDLIGDYSIHYNPDFVVEMAISDCIINVDPIEILNGTFAFLLAHEAFHVLKYHIYNQTGATNDIDHELANILEDSFINTQLIDIFSKPGVFSNKRKLSMGVGNDLKFSGEYNSIYKDTGSVADDIAQIFGAKSKRAKGGSIPPGSRGFIRIYYSSDILQSIFNGNSNRFVRALSAISTKIIKNPKVSLDNLMDTLNSIMENSLGSGQSDSQGGASNSSSGGGASNSNSSGSSSGGSSGSSSGSPSGSSSGSPSGGSSNVSSGDSSGGSGSSSGPSSGNSSSSGAPSGGPSEVSSGSQGGSNVSSGDGSGSSSGGNNSKTKTSSKEGSGEGLNKLSDLLQDLANKISEGNKNKTESDTNMGSSSSATAKVKEKLNDAVREVEKNTKNGNGNGKPGSSESSDNKSKESALIDGLGISKGVINTSTVKSWKSSLKKVLRECLGSTENYNPNLPSARIRGQLGRDEDVSAPKAICLMVDQSGSMNVNKFSEALNEIEVFVKTARLRNVKVHLIMWGSTAKYYKLSSTRDLAKNVKSKEEGLMGTDPNTFMDIVKQKCKRCDAYICFTDGQMNNDFNDESLLYFRKIKNRFVWVLTKSDYYLPWIVKTDTGSKNRTIIPK